MRFKSTSVSVRVAFAILLAASVSVGSRSGMGPFAAQAQNIGQRVVMGAVVDANSASVVGATVFLKDLKSKTIRSYTTNEKGRFQFAQVNMAEDHELWAEKGGKKTVAGFFVGQVMKASKGQANPALLSQLVSKKLEG